MLFVEKYIINYFLFKLLVLTQSVKESILTLEINHQRLIRTNAQCRHSLISNQDLFLHRYTF